ncbi:hypothetical protein D0839_12100 [Bordetella avium]|nr:hypothetical protein C0J09_08525 [Bordetella avium]AZY52531.1 hypothetical protein C0J07_08485 [Bordetella avium]RIQ12328.1 hypothetical protein D0432_13925 [Bordetella avium]RIQ19303.1 hypothetical protein D0850_04385 [Bordetella avium]RIQ33472.1 hypothetical protein D0849_11075 [Bordetella avium]
MNAGIRDNKAGEDALGRGWRNRAFAQLGQKHVARGNGRREEQRQQAQIGGRDESEEGSVRGRPLSAAALRLAGAG